MTHLAIHAGIHKTGSTFLQVNLRANRALLNEAGFGYLHHADVRQSLWWRYVEGRTEKRKDAIAKLAESVATETGHVYGPVKSLLYSSEILFGRLNHLNVKKADGGGLYQDAITRLTRFLDLITALPEPGFEKISLCFFYRQQSRFLASCYGQMFNEGYDPGSFSEFIDRIDLADLSWKALLQRLDTLCENFPQLEIRAEPYESWIGPDFLPNFLTDILGWQGLTLENWRIKQVANPSLSPRGMDLARDIRKVCTAEEWAIFRRTMQSHFTAKTDADRNWLPAELIARCGQLFSAENQTLPGAPRAEHYY